MVRRTKSLEMMKVLTVQWQILLTLCPILIVSTAPKKTIATKKVTFIEGQLLQSKEFQIVFFFFYFIIQILT